MEFEHCTMVHRYEQVRVYTPKEFERRWALAREVAAKAGCGALLVCGPSAEGLDQYLADVRGLSAVILPLRGGAVGILRGRLDRGDGSLQIREVTHPDIRVLKDYPGGTLADLLGPAGSRVAVAFPGAMSAILRDALDEVLPGTELVDVTLPLTVARAAKSEEDLRCIALANRVHEQAMLAMPQVIRVGRTFRDVSNDITELLCSLGSGNALIHAFLICVGPMDGPADMRAFFPAPGRVFEPGDRMQVLMETNGPGGHVTAIGRFFCLGEPTESWQKLVDMCIRAQDFAVSMLKPGERLTNIVRQTRRFIEGCGWETNDQCFMHGMGYHMYEQYAINDMTEDVPLCDGAFLHAHPVIKRRYPGMDWVEPFHHLDAYLVGPEGGVCTNHVPRKLFVLD